MCAVGSSSSSSLCKQATTQTKTQVNEKENKKKEKGWSRTRRASNRSHRRRYRCRRAFESRTSAVFFSVARQKQLTYIFAVCQVKSQTNEQLFAFFCLVEVIADLLSSVSSPVYMHATTNSILQTKQTNDRSVTMNFSRETHKKQKQKQEQKEGNKTAPVAAEIGPSAGGR